MGLAEAMLDLADEVEEEAKKFPGPTDTIPSVFLNYLARQIRRAVKAAEGSTPTRGYLTPEAQHQAEIAKAREEFRRARVQGDGGERMVVIKGGPFNGNMLPVAADMPKGARCEWGGSVFVLGEDDQLHPEAEVEKA